MTYNDPNGRDPSISFRRAKRSTGLRVVSGPGVPSTPPSVSYFARFCLARFQIVGHTAIPYVGGSPKRASAADV